MKHVILTAYLTGQPDPQRDVLWPVRWGPLGPLLLSVLDIGAAFVVFANELAGPFVERVAPPRSVFFDRWAHYAAWLERHQETDFAWCVDATDVLVLNDPFLHMERGRLYCGTDNEPMTGPWMLRHHEVLHPWLEANRERPLLNCGLVGGDRETVVRLCRRMGEEQRGMIMDMGTFNFLAYEEFAIVSGPLVHTLYKAYETTGTAWFKHK